MCGISIILDYKGNVQSEHILRMMDAIKHRGPDASNQIEKPFGNGKLFLGSNRLQIIDKDNHSNQPFVSADSRHALVFNGEIYNYEELRNQLLTAGIQFKTRSDTETLLYWLIHKGKNGIQQLNGMFAFVFADFETSKLIIARDRFGIKPLFIHQSLTGFIASSEILGIFASGLLKKELNEEVIPHYLAYKYAARPATFFKGVEEVMPGSIWEIDKEGKTKKSVIEEQPIKESIDVKQALIDAVVRQYSEATNTGVMLSGGVDSTLLLAILNKELGYRNIPVYLVATIGKNKHNTHDGSYAAKAAKLYQADYNKIGIDESALNRLDDYINTLGQPIADSGGFLTWLIGETAIGKSKVLLSGAGADELFGGYNRHKAFYNYLKYKNKQWFQLVRKGKALPSFIPKINHLKKLINSISSTPSATFNNFVQSDNFRIEANLWEDNVSNEAHLKNALQHDQQNYLGADVLAITDNALMQHAVEARVPYLDNAIVQAAQKLPTSDLFKNGTKWQLKEQLINYGGKEFANRAKKGLGLPMNDWLKNKSLWDFNNTDQHIHSFIPQQKLSTLYNKHTQGKEDNTQDLYRILVLHKWLSHNF